MRGKIACALVVLVLCAVLAACFWGPRQTEVVLATQVELGPGWREFKAGRHLKPTHPVSLLLLEVPGLRIGAGGDGLSTDDGKELDVDGYLTTISGEKLPLGSVSTAAYGTRTFLRLQSTRLQWNQPEVSFAGVSLRADRSLEAGRLIWISYDPRTTKDGLPSTEALR